MHYCMAGLPCKSVHIKKEHFPLPLPVLCQLAAVKGKLSVDMGTPRVCPSGSFCEASFLALGAKSPFDSTVHHSML